MDKLRALNIFVHVVDVGSFASVARTLNVAPAVVTRAVAELESHLGVRLLNRTTRRLSITSAGEEYLAHIRPLLAGLDEADSIASAGAKDVRGTLRIASPAVEEEQKLLQCATGFERNTAKPERQVVSDFDLAAWPGHESGRWAAHSQ